MKLANAGLLNMGTTAKKVAGIVRAYSKDGRTAAEVTEVIGALSIKTALTLQEALNTMSRSGSMGALYGQSLEQIAAAMGAVANAGIPAMRAATAVENAMRDLYSNKNRVVNALEEIGVSAYTAEGGLRPMITVFEELQVAMKDMTDQERIRYSQQLTTIRGSRALNAIMAQEITTLGELEQAITDTTYAAQLAQARTMG